MPKELSYFIKSKIQDIGESILDSIRDIRKKNPKWTMDETIDFIFSDFYYYTDLEDILGEVHDKGIEKGAEEFQHEYRNAIDFRKLREL